MAVPAGAGTSTPRRRPPAPVLPVADRIEALARPLEFASRDGGAHADRIQGLEQTVAAAGRRVLEVALPRDVTKAIQGVVRVFDAPIDPDKRAETVRAALEALAPLRAPGWAEGLLGRPLSVLPGVGPKRAEALEKRGLATVGQLLFHLPVRYDDRRELAKVGELQVGTRATFVAQVRSSESIAGPRRGRGGIGRGVQAVVGDETGSILLKWFRSGDVIQSQLGRGQWLLVTGEVKRYRFSKELVHPEIEPIDPDAELGPERPADADVAVEGSALRQVVADYVAPEGVNPRTLRGLIQRAVFEYSELVAGHLPAELVEARGLPEVADALRAVHAPDPDADVEAYREFASKAHERLVLEELYLLELGLALRRQHEGRAPGIAIPGARASIARAAGGLPFALTGAQRRVLEEIGTDLERPHPMSRLVQGDVGSGKTAVALLAAAGVAAAGHQTALMAPTELLAEQHARTLDRLCAGAGGPRELGLRTGLLTASVARRDAKTLRGAIAEGEVDLVVGTHALVQGDVTFAKLGLAIVDEQHRFGVLQRGALAERTAGGPIPHSLIMTATPIPRTLSMTLYGDLDVSVIDELPPGREPVETWLLRGGSEGRRITEAVRKTLQRGEQVYVVYPLVEESEKIDLRSAIESAERIRRAFSDVRVDLVHGRLEAAERAAAMARFESGETRILVSTTVIEVGVDVPEATLMVIEHAERFGLAQLHQLRGRVGRGARPGTCILVARGGGEKGEARLRAMLETRDGFAIAEADLRIRGPGDFLGTRQSGHLPELRIADLLRDVALVGVAREAARAEVDRDPGLADQPETRRAVAARWGDRLKLADIG